MILDELLAGFSREAFLDRFFLKLPYASPSGAERLCELGDWQRIDRLLAAPGADVLAGSAGTAHPAPPQTAAQARALLEQGLTIGIRHADRHDRQLAALADEFRRAFAAPIDVHLYCTPAGREGFGWHYDAEDVFLVQAAGAKQWDVRKNTVNPWPLIETLPSDMRYGREQMPLVRCTLEAGQWLYLPAGYWHHSHALEESISLSIGVASATAIDLFDFLRARLVESLRWRQRLPTPGEATALDAAQLAEAYRPLVAELACDLAAQLSDVHLLRDFVAARRAIGRPRAGDGRKNAGQRL